MTGCPVLTISLDKLVPLGASPVSNPFLDDGERERSDPGRADTAISRRWMTLNRPALIGMCRSCRMVPGRCLLESGVLDGVRRYVWDGVGNVWDSFK